MERNPERRLLATSMLAAALACGAADPHVGYVYPAGIAAGTTNQLVVGGQGFWGKLDAVAGAGVRVLGIETVPSFPVTGHRTQAEYLRKWLDGLARGDRVAPPLPDVPALHEWRECAWWRKLDGLSPLERSLVERDLFIPKNRLQMAPNLRQLVLVTVAAEPDAAPGRRDFLFYTPNGASVPYPFFVSAAPHVAEALFVPAHRRTGKGARTGKRNKGGNPAMSSAATPPVRFPVPCVLDGQILPGETDRFLTTFRAGQRIRFTVTARELQPFIGDAVPGFFNPVLRLTGPSGKEIAFADDDAFRPDPVLNVVAPETGDYVLEVRDNLFRGREDFVYLVTVEDSPADRPPAYVPPPGDGRTLFSGTIAAPGRSNVHEVEIPAAGTYDFTLTARAAGSPLDAVVTLAGPVSDWWPWGEVPLLGTWDDVTNEVFVGRVPQAECDPSFTWSFPAPGRYRATVTDRTGAGGADYTYSLRVKPEEPDFAVYALRSTLPARLGVRTPLKVKVTRRGGFAGAVTLLESSELRFENACIPATSCVATVTAVGKLKDTVCTPTVLWAAGMEGEKAFCRRVTPTDEAVQAFAWNHLVPAPAFRCFAAAWESPPPKPAVWRELPPKAYADMRVRTNAVPAVAATASDGQLGMFTADRLLRGRPLVRARGTAVPRARVNGLFLAGVTEIVDGQDAPSTDAYTRRLMGLAQNSAADIDVWVYTPSNAVTAASHLCRRLADAGWCAGLLPAERLDAWNSAERGRALAVAAGTRLAGDVRKALVAKIRALDAALVFEGDAPRALDVRLRPKGNVRLHTFGRGKIVAGPLEEAMDHSAAKREPFTRETGLRFMRRKDGPETLYFLVNAGTARVTGGFAPTARMGTVSILNPETGEARRVPTQKKGAVDLDLAPGAAIWLQCAPKKE